MGTRSKTTIFDEQGKPLLSFYRQFDGYFEGHGQELADFLKDIVIVNGFGSGTPAKAANGMGCLAAQLVKHFKEGIGGIYIVGHDDNQEYNYEVRFVKTSNDSFGAKNRVLLVGKGHKEVKKFALYDDEILDTKPTVLKVVSFVYDKRDGSQPAWRTLHVTAENDTYIEGLENGQLFKRFLKNRIVGNRIVPN